MSLPFYVSYIGLWIVALFQTVLLIGLIRTVYRKAGEQPVGRSEQELAPGSPLPAFEARTMDGETIDSRSLRGRQTALLFVSPKCDSCAVTLEELEALKSKTGGHVVLFCLADRPTCAELVEQHRLSVPVVVDDEHRIAGLLRVTSAPTAVLVDRFNNVETYGHPRAPVELESLLTIVPSEDEFLGEVRNGNRPDRVEVR